MGLASIQLRSTFALIFSPSGGTFGLLTDGGGGPIYTDEWNGSLLLDVDAILAAKVLSGDIPAFSFGCH